MEIQILELIEGARAARGLTVIIDVFRAFTLECYLFAGGARAIYPTGSLEDAFAMKAEDPSLLLFGERGGAIVPGFDYGNSPAEAVRLDLTGRTIIHSTSAGTQGIVNAAGADEIIAGGLVNAAAIAAYIRRRNPEQVSLVGMGNAGVRTAGEDMLCALYIRSILEGQPMFVQPLADALRETDGAKFFDPARTEFPQADFPLCVDCDRFPFVLRLERDERGRNRMVPVHI